MNKGEAIDRVLHDFREGLAPVYWGRAELGAYYNAGLAEFMRKSGIVTERFLIQCKAGQHIVPLPKHAVRALTVRDVTHAQNPVPVKLDHWKTVDMLDTYFERTNAARPEIATSFGLGKIFIWPAYASDYYSALRHDLLSTLEVMATVIEADPLDESETPRFPDEYHQSLVEYMEWRGLLKDVSDPGRLGRAKRHRREFGQALGSAGTYAVKRHTNIVRSIYGGAS